MGLLIGVLAPWVGNALYILRLSPFPNLDLTPFAFTLTGLGISWSLFHFRLLDIVPAAHKTIFESMNDVVIVMDAQNRIVDLNPAAQRVFGCSASDSVGQPVEKILSLWPDLVDHCRPLTETHSEIAWGDNGKKRYFDLNISPLRDKQNLLTGRVIVLRDITEHKQAGEILQNAHDQLEKQVETRTSELKKVNVQLKKEIEERVSVEKELKESLKLIGRAKREWESTTDSLPQLDLSA